VEHARLVAEAGILIEVERIVEEKVDPAWAGQVMRGLLRML